MPGAGIPARRRDAGGAAPAGPAGRLSNRGRATTVGCMAEPPAALPSNTAAIRPRRGAADHVFERVADQRRIVGRALVWTSYTLWVLTVFTLNDSPLAIAVSDLPSAIAHRISYSRFDSRSLRLGRAFFQSDLLRQQRAQILFSRQHPA